MGKSQKPLTIEVSKNLGEWEEIKALEAQGHTIWVRAWEAQAPDLILGPTCHRMNEDLRKYLPLALAEGRRVRYPKAAKETDGTPTS